MGRRIPSDENLLIHPEFSFSLLAIGMVATIAMIAALCGVRSRKKSSPLSSPPLNKKEENSVVSNSASSTVTITSSKAAEPVELEDSSHNKKPQIKELPLPPSMKPIKESHSCNLITKSSSERRLPMSLSMKLPRSLSTAKREENRRKEENHQQKKGDLNSEDTVWMKTIILGEKCKVPAEDDAAVIYDGKGNRISAYHPKTPSMFSLSRQCSFKDPDSS